MGLAKILMGLIPGWKLPKVSDTRGVAEYIGRKICPVTSWSPGELPLVYILPLKHRMPISMMNGWDSYLDDPQADLCRKKKAWDRIEALNSAFGLSLVGIEGFEGDTEEEGIYGIAKRSSPSDPNKEIRRIMAEELILKNAANKKGFLGVGLEEAVLNRVSGRLVDLYYNQYENIVNSALGGFSSQLNQAEEEGNYDKCLAFINMRDEVLQRTIREMLNRVMADFGIAGFLPPVDADPLNYDAEHYTKSPFYKALEQAQEEYSIQKRNKFAIEKVLSEAARKEKNQAVAVFGPRHTAGMCEELKQSGTAYIALESII